MDVKTRQELIAKYRDGFRVVAESLAGCGEKELDAHTHAEQIRRARAAGK